MPTSAEAVVPRMTERQLQEAIVQVAGLLRYRAYHAWISVRSTPGYPDLTLVGGPDPARPRLLFVEVKAARGRLSPEQEAWLDALGRVPGVEVFCWYPKHWGDGTIERVLRDE